MVSPVRIEAVTFDVGGTLIEPWPSVGAVYAEVASRFGVRADPDRLNRQFAAAWRARRGFDYSQAAWLDLVACSFAGIIEPLPTGYFDAVYAQFARPEVWRIFEDVVPTLERLRRQGVRVGIVSNWDERLEPLLEALNLRHCFEDVAVSFRVGHTKPAPEIFQYAAQRFGLPPAAMLHLGDSQVEDVVGARSAGMQARLIHRGEAPAAYERLRTLGDLFMDLGPAEG